MTEITPARMRELADFAPHGEFCDVYNSRDAACDCGRDEAAAALRAAADQQERDAVDRAEAQGAIEALDRENDALRATLAARDALLKRAGKQLEVSAQSLDRWEPNLGAGSVSAHANRALAAEIAAALSPPQRAMTPEERRMMHEALMASTKLEYYLDPPPFTRRNLPEDAMGDYSRAGIPPHPDDQENSNG